MDTHSLMLLSLSADSAPPLQEHTWGASPRHTHHLPSQLIEAEVTWVESVVWKRSSWSTGYSLFLILCSVSLCSRGLLSACQSSEITNCVAVGRNSSVCAETAADRLLKAAAAKVKEEVMYHRKPCSRKNPLYVKSLLRAEVSLCHKPRNVTLSLMLDSIYFKCKT